jgi:hypothetical protein
MIPSCRQTYHSLYAWSDRPLFPDAWASNPKKIPQYNHPGVQQAYAFSVPIELLSKHSSFNGEL